MAKRKTTSTALDSDAVRKFVDEAPSTKTIDIPTEAQANEDPAKMPFFDMVRAFTAAQWEQMICYLYRLEPEVVNAPGEPSFIQKITQPFDEEFVRKYHGGGKYQAWLKRSNGDTVRKHNFRIAGEPILKPEQTVKNPAAPAGVVMPPTTAAPAPQTAESVLADALTKALAAISKNNVPQDEAVKMLMHAHTSSMDLVTNSLKNQASSATGSSIGDKLLDAFMASSLAAKKEDPLAGIMKMLELAKAMGFSPAGGASSNPIEMLKGIKDLLGPEGFGDFLGGGGSEKRSGWGEVAAVGSQLVGQLPKVIEGYVAVKDKELQIAQVHERVIRMRIGAGLPAIEGPAAGVTAVPSQPSTPTATAPRQPGPALVTAATPGAGAIPTPTSDDAMDQIATLILRSFEAGDAGDMAAIVVSRTFPVESEQMKPFLADTDMVLTLARSSPILAGIAGDPEFPQFADDFVAYMKGEEIEGGDDAEALKAPTLVMPTGKA